MLSPNTILNDFSPDIERTQGDFSYELLKIHTIAELKIFLKTVISRYNAYQDLYNTTDIDEIIRLISIDTFNVIESALKLKANSNTDAFPRIININKYRYHYYH